MKTKKILLLLVLILAVQNMAMAASKHYLVETADKLKDGLDGETKMKAPAEMFHEMDSLVQAALDHAPVAHAASLLSAQSSLEKMLPQDGETMEVNLDGETVEVPAEMVRASIGRLSKRLQKTDRMNLPRTTSDHGPRTRDARDCIPLPCPLCRPLHRKEDAVCGSDGKTYEDSCRLSTANCGKCYYDRIKIEHKGECDSEKKDKLHPVGAILSSEHSHWNAGHCINGKTSDFCHTKDPPHNEPFPWLAIDFGERVRVGRVVIINRRDCCGERTRNVEIRISDKLPTSRGKMFKGGYFLSNYYGPGKNGEEISLGSMQGWKENYGRYLIIQMDNGNDVLNFAEVTAFGGVRGFTNQRGCIIEDGIDYYGHDLLAGLKKENWQECADFAASIRFRGRGRFWTWNKKSKECFVKRSNSGRKNHGHAMSGNKECAITEYELMLWGVGCPPGREVEEDECRQLTKVASLEFGEVGTYGGVLPKCFLWRRDRVYYNRGGGVPPSKRHRSKHKAICKKERTPVECPVKQPDLGSSCSLPETIRCPYGEECCCGRCHPSLNMVCGGRRWIGYYTDKCVRNNGECGGFLGAGQDFRIKERGRARKGKAEGKKEAPIEFKKGKDGKRVRSLLDG